MREGREYLCLTGRDIEDSRGQMKMRREEMTFPSGKGDPKSLPRSRANLLMDFPQIQVLGSVLNHGASPASPISG